MKYRVEGIVSRVLALAVVPMMAFAGGLNTNTNQSVLSSAASRAMRAPMWTPLTRTRRERHSWMTASISPSTTRHSGRIAV